MSKLNLRRNWGLVLVLIEISFNDVTDQVSSLLFVWWSQVNYLSFHPCNEWVLATASSDTTVGLFDMRKLTVPLHALSGHTYALYVLPSLKLIHIPVISVL